VGFISELEILDPCDHEGREDLQERAMRKPKTKIYQGEKQ
jgi:hypothetical protein